MRRVLPRIYQATLLAALALTGAAAAGAAGEVRQLEWDDLMPKDWDPFAKLRELMDSRTDALVDGTPEADRLMREYINAGSAAPVVAGLNGERVRLPGFVLPLDYEGTEVSEFLLVPYFGACIHVPPPPANQIVFVKSGKSYVLKELFDAVWVTGTLKTEGFNNDLGYAGYTMEATNIEPYDE